MLCRLCCKEGFSFEDLYDKDDRENCKYKTCQKFFFREMEKLDNTLKVCSKVICSDCWKAINDFNDFYEKVIAQQTDYCNLMTTRRSLGPPEDTVKNEGVEATFVIDDAFLKKSLVERPKNCETDTLVVASSVPNGSAKHEIKISGLNESQIEIEVDGGENEMIELRYSDDDDDDASQSLSNCIPVEVVMEASYNESKDQERESKSPSPDKIQEKKTEKPKKVHKANRKNLAEHYNTHKVENDQNHKCPKCDKRFNSKKNLYAHYKRIHSENDNKSENDKWVCGLCGTKASSYANLDVHKRTRLCKIRQMKPENKSIMDKANQIIKEIEDGSWQPILRCDLCEYTSERPLLFKTHYKEFHPENFHSKNFDKPFQCEFCQHCFRDKTSLRIHLYSHGDTNTFLECPHCAKGFRHRRSLEKHILGVHPESTGGFERSSKRKSSNHEAKRKKPVKAKLDSCDKYGVPLLIEQSLQQHIEDAISAMSHMSSETSGVAPLEAQCCESHV